MAVSPYCLVCGAPTNLNQARAKYCSRRCKGKAARLMPVGKVVAVTMEGVRVPAR